MAGTPFTIDLASAEVFTYFLVFARLGGAIMVLPGFGETTVSSRVRLLLAFTVTVALAPVARQSLPALPVGFLPMMALVIGELAIGLLIGLFARVFMSALQVAGQAIAMQTGLGAAMVMDPTIGIQGAMVGTLLSVLAVTLIFVTDMHYLFLEAAYSSYAVFPAGTLPPLDDVSILMTRTVADAFRLGIGIASPFIVFGLVFYSAVGVLSKLMPQMQIFFLAMPLSILMGLTLFGLLLGTIMTFFLEALGNHMGRFLGG